MWGGDIFNNIGNNLSWWDDNLGAFLIYHQDQLLGMTSSKMDIDKYILSDMSTFRSLMDKNSSLDVKYQIELMKRSIYKTQGVFLENAVKMSIKASGETLMYVGVGTVLAGSAIPAGVASLMIKAGVSVGYADLGVTLFGNARNGDYKAAFRNAGIAGAFYGTGKLYKNANTLIDDRIQLTIGIFEKTFSNRINENDKKKTNNK